MNKKVIPLAHLKKGKTGRIIDIHGGHHDRHHGPHHGHHGFGFRKRLNVLGIREGQIVRILSKQPFMGPLTIAIGSTHMTIGRGMAHKIIVEEL
jgi:Fe2+ transport system protein FeoA